MTGDQKSTEAARRDHGPLRIMFANTSLLVGGAECLQMQILEKLDRKRFTPMVCCLKEPGPLGDRMVDKIPVFSELLSHKYDLRVIHRLTQLLKQQKVDALVTVGAGDKMFWGRLAARRARVPVVVSAIHSTGWPDTIGRLNRMLTSITDAFIAVAPSHGEYLVQQEGFPRSKVEVIPNGVDTDRFAFSSDARMEIRREFDIPMNAPCVGIVAALRPEKQHQIFLKVASELLIQMPTTHFLIVGEGPQRPDIEHWIASQNLTERVHLTGARHDIPACLSALDLFLLTSKMEANPVSILEAMSIGVPIVSTRVGSIEESVENGVTGLLVNTEAGAQGLAQACQQILSRPQAGLLMGKAGRDWVRQNASVESMVRGYESLITRIYASKTGERHKSETPATASPSDSIPLGSESDPRP